MKENENSDLKWLELAKYNEKIQQKIKDLESDVREIKHKQEALFELSHALNVLNISIEEREEILLSVYEKVSKQIEAL